MQKVATRLLQISFSKLLKRGACQSLKTLQNFLSLQVIIGHPWSSLFLSAKSIAKKVYSSLFGSFAELQDADSKEMLQKT